jgi:hypothetical protein
MITNLLQKHAGRVLLLTVSAALMAGSAAAKVTDHGYVKARGGPEDAAIFINGKYIGPASRYTVPERYDAPLGDIEVTFRDPRYEEFTARVKVEPGKTVHIHYNLKKLVPPNPPFGLLRFVGGGTTANEGSLSGGDIGAVYVNDKYYGYVQELNHVGTGILLTPGTYDLHVDSPVFRDVRQKITIEADKTLTVPLTKK